MDPKYDFSTEYQIFKSMVDEKIENYWGKEEPLLEGLYKSINYSLNDGKRVRALYAFLVGEIFDVKPEKLLTTAVAIEMIHAASLIMDDLPYMDNAELRRGKPANHIVFGQDVALCASIALISEANRLVLSDQGLGLDERNRASNLLGASFGINGLAAGQYVDLKLKRKNIKYEIIEFINAKKTAALFTAAGEIAAIIGHASEEQLDAIKVFSENVGFAFQITDDILDVKGDEKLVGKDLNKDKMNFVRLVGMNEAEKYAKSYIKTAKASMSVFKEKGKKIIEFGDYLINRGY